MPDLRIGSLCTGYGGLDTAVQAVFGGTTAWVSNIDPGASKILAHHLPNTPNLGDLTTTNWDQAEPVDIVCGGYPCQPFSTAGKRKGTSDERHIWPDIARALRVLRPQLAIFENVANHLRLGFDQVLRDLAAIGFDAEWCLVRASEVGAPHQRSRLFLYAWPADTQGPRLSGQGIRGRTAERGAAPADTDRVGSDRRAARTEQAGREVAPSDAPADTHRNALREQPVTQPRRRSTAVAELARPDAPADPQSIGRGEGRPEPARLEGRPDVALSSTPDWGAYAPAIARWEAITGRPAPWATDARNRLNPAFVEWLMGLPAGHVTDVPGLTRTQQLKALGNGVVPQQAEAAIRLLHDRANTA
ncbi:DNA cytosine methyltransferase [Streptomyces sp. P9(2023)]|uniref:DNA cytosine methyltransferase n=1 Tax=Streptomyces sp. P9(2023) TaxID=3064394 RepID=UPI0028F4331A|nr:DNA cytosine methyltransferase [Streptomyces sp. P9(2023)]MDT9688167.1 DNA cytosine methyltransferase [Streptomyces sp. P9(2023)]